MNNLDAMEALLPQQQANCAITHLYDSILSSYLAHMLLGKNIIGAPVFQGSTVVMVTENFAIT